MLQCRTLPVLVLFLAVTAGCRTPLSTASRQPLASDRPFEPVAQAGEPAIVVPAIEQASISADESDSTASRLWSRIRSARRISFPQTDFRQDENDGEVLEPASGFDTGF